MGRRKSFVYDMYPQDFNDGVKGFSPATVGIYIMLINLMRVEGGALPPRRLKKPRGEFDDWIRDKLNLKNVKTWRNAKAELLADPDKLVELPDGRIANPRTERDIAAKRGGEGGSGGQEDEARDGAEERANVLPFDRSTPAVSVGNSVDDAVEGPGKETLSTEVIEKICGSSSEVMSIGPRKSLISLTIGCVSPSPCIPVSLLGLRLPSPASPRARGDPLALRA